MFIRFCHVLKGIGLIISLIVGCFIADSILFNGVQPIAINENGFQANYFVKTDTKRKAAIVLIGGGQWGVIDKKESVFTCFFSCGQKGVCIFPFNSGCNLGSIYHCKIKQKQK